MSDKVILLTAPCGCQAYQEGTTWGMTRCAWHTKRNSVSPEVADYFDLRAAWKVEERGKRP